MNENSKLRMFLAGVVWLIVIGLGVTVWKLWWSPRQEAAVKKAKDTEQKQILESTSSHANYEHEVTINLDSFSAYCQLRSREFRDECGRKKIKVNIVDDQANYVERIKALLDGKADMATFTIDTLIKTSSISGSLPATIVLLLDETKGADAIVAEKKTFPNIDAMNDSNVEIVATVDSPSEFLPKVVMHHYNLPQLSPNNFKFVQGPDKVYDAYKNAKPGEKRVFVLWEPFVSKMVANPDYHVLIASDKLRGYIVDVLVVNRSFLVKNQQVVDDVVKSYLMTAFNNRATMVQMVSDDARKLGEPLQPEQAKKLVSGIWWKNTSENFGHFGLTSGNGLQTLDEMVSNINEVLLKTGTIKTDPAGGQNSRWYYDGLMRRLFEANWHPGFEDEKVRKEAVLRELSEEEWKKLEPVGTIKVNRLVFARGTTTMTESSESILTDLEDKLRSWPQFYIQVKGHAMRSTDPETQKANQDLARQRADAAVKWLVDHGVGKARIRSDNGDPNGSSTVAFVLGQIPY